MPYGQKATSPLMLSAEMKLKSLWRYSLPGTFSFGQFPQSSFLSGDPADKPVLVTTLGHTFSSIYPDRKDRLYKFSTSFLAIKTPGDYLCRIKTKTEEL